MNIKIDFIDFWGGFNKKDNFFYNLLIENFDVEISNNPDFIIYSVFGNQHQKYSCKKIFFTGENIAPNMGECDWAFSFDYLDNDRCYRLPLYVLYDGYYDLVNKKVDDSLLNRKFCNFVVSNGGNPIRNNFFLKLSKYKHVDSGGRFWNNIGAPVQDKLNFQSEYKFSLAFENNAHRNSRIGYTTEKIMEPMKVNSIPIYWGNEWVDKDFNKESFVNYYDFKNEDELIEYIIYLDQNDDKYMGMLKKPWFVNNEIPQNNKKENIKLFLNKIFLNK
jgi:alpha(1,3/1,4) fucosyltransferase